MQRGPFLKQRLKLQGEGFDYIFIDLIIHVHYNAKHNNLEQ